MDALDDDVNRNWRVLPRGVVAGDERTDDGCDAPPRGVVAGDERVDVERPPDCADSATLSTFQKLPLSDTR